MGDHALPMGQTCNHTLKMNRHAALSASESKGALRVIECALAEIVAASFA